MNERFLLPTAVAATLHAILFFGFNRGEIPVHPDDPRVATAALPPNALKLEWTAPEDDQEVSQEPKAASPAPDLPDPPPRDADLSKDITIEREMPRVTSPGPVATIPTGPFGPSDGGPGDRWGKPGPVSFDHLDNPPRTRAQIAPVYPSEARRDGRPGEVWVEFVVDESGRVLDPHVVRSNDRIFDEPTLRAVGKWRFEPGRKNGRVVRFRMAVPVAYAVNP